MKHGSGAAAGRIDSLSKPRNLAAVKRDKVSSNDGPIRALADFATLPLEQVPKGLPAEVFTAPGILALADVLPVMIAFIDPDLRFGFVNQPLAEWFEVPRRDLVGKSIEDLIGPERLAERIGNFR